MKSIGTEQARKLLPELLERAYRHGKATVITKRGVPYATLAPVAVARAGASESLLDLRGTGKRCYRNGARHVRALRSEWD